MSGAATAAALQHPWFSGNVTSILRPLWKEIEVGHWLLQVSVGAQLVVGHVIAAHAGTFGWQIDFGASSRMEDFLDAPRAQAQTLVERGILEFAQLHGGHWRARRGDDVPPR